MLKSYDQIWDGDLDKIINLPVESFLPLLLIRHYGAFTEKFEITNEHFEFGLDPEVYMS